MTNVLLKVEQLKKYFPKQKKGFTRTKEVVKAVDGVSFEVKEGETFGIVGESGCGKSTTGRMILRLLEPTDGKIYFNGIELTSLSKNEMRKARRDLQMVFQDPYASLNPRHTVEDILEEPLIVHGIGNKNERKERVKEFLQIVGLNTYHAKRYPHQFSGGQRQRIGIARALMTNPKLIIADEPVSALDVSIQAQILNLMKRLQEDLKLTYIFISHDLGVVRHISDRVGVMYFGRLVEIADCDSLYEEPLHPYTKVLLSSVPIPDPDYKKEEILVKGDFSKSVPKNGCLFQTRCPFATEACKTMVPELKQVRPGHSVACHLYEASQQ